eukprot:3655121-Pyramimonas_sp.AAC.1
MPQRLFSGTPCQETPCLPPGCPGFLGFRWFCKGRPGVSGLGFLWKVSCCGAPTSMVLQGTLSGLR